MIDLPPLRSSRYCVLMPRNPHGLYVYWGLNPHDIATTLRVHELSGKTWDLDITASSRNYYIKVPHANADYCVKVGFKKGNKAFVALEKSNVTRTPPEGLSSRQDLIWQDIKGSKVSRPYIQEDVAIGLPRQKRIYYLTTLDVQRYYRKRIQKALSISWGPKTRPMAWRVTKPGPWGSLNG